MLHYVYHSMGVPYLCVFWDTIDVMALSEDMVPPNPVAYHYLHHFPFFWPIKGIPSGYLT